MKAALPRPKTHSYPSWTVGILLSWSLLIPSACRSAAPGDQPPAVTFRHEPNRLHIEIGSRPFAVYSYFDKDIPRPYFSQVKSPSGIQVTRAHPPDPDQDLMDHALMHPGIWMAFGDVSGNDYWRLKARVEHERFLLPPQGGPGSGRFGVRNFFLKGESSERIAAEEVQYSIHAEPEGYWLLWDSSWTPEAEPIVFGDQEEMGLGFRVASRLAEQLGGRITDSEGRQGAPQIWGKAAAWIDYSGMLEGQWVGLSLMADPANFRESWFHARDYGLIAANPFGRQAMQAGPPSRTIVQKGEKLRLRYGLLIHSSADQSGLNLAEAHRRFLAFISTP